MGVLIVIAVAGGLIAGGIAQSKGHSFGGYFILGFLLPLVGILVAAVARPNRGALLTPADGIGWHRDPTGRFDVRYFDGQTWTRFVGRQGDQFEDIL